MVVKPPLREAITSGGTLGSDDVGLETELGGVSLGEALVDNGDGDQGPLGGELVIPGPDCDRRILL